MTHPRDDLLDLLFVTLHLDYTPDTNKADILPIPQADDLIESSQEIESPLLDLPLPTTPLHPGTHPTAQPQKITNDADEEFEGVDILEDVGCEIRDEDQV